MKIFASILILFLAYNFALACTCSNTNEAQRVEALKKIEIVFQGEVQSVSEPYAIKLKNSKGRYYGELLFVDVKFKVIRAWKGVENPQIVIRTFPKSNSCSIHFEVGMKPYVLANGKPPQTDYCYANLIDWKKNPEILGEGKSFEEIPPSSKICNKPKARTVIGINFGNQSPHFSRRNFSQFNRITRNSANFVSIHVFYWIIIV